MNNISSRTEKTISGSLWMLAGHGGRQLLMLVMSVVLARILSPADFAAVALVLAILTIVESLSQLGLSVALVQRSDVTRNMLDSAFTLTVVLFFSGAVLLVVISGPFAQYYRLALLKPLIKLTAITIILSGFSSFYRCLLLRDMRYEVISMAELLSSFVYGAIAISLGAFGYGAYSILWGHIGAAFLMLVLFIAREPYMPTSLGSVLHMKELLSFGVWVSMGRVLQTASGQFDRLLIGKLLTEKTLGGYYIAHRIVMAVPTLITATLDQVLLPIYSNAKNDPQVIERGYWKGLRYSAILVVPTCLLISIYAPSLVWLVLGVKWLFIVPIVRILSIFGAIQGLGGGIFSSVINASGVPQLNPVITGFRIIVLPLCVLIGCRWGVEGVAWGMVCFGLIGRLFNQWLLRYYIGYRFLTFFRTIAYPLLANAGMGIVGWGLHGIITLDNPLAVFGMTATCGITCTVSYLWLCRFLMPEEYDFLVAQFQGRIDLPLRSVLTSLIRRIKGTSKQVLP